MNREEVLQLVKNRGSNLRFVDENFRNDKEIVMRAVKQNGGSLFWASDNLKNDKEVVIEAIKNHPDSIKYASNELQNDIEIKEVLFGVLGSNLRKKLNKPVYALLIIPLIFMLFFGYLMLM